MNHELLTTYRIPLVFGAVGLGCIILLVILNVREHDSSDGISFDTQEASRSGDRQELVVVNVEGAVSKPGIYRLPFGSRVDDLLQAAGGVSVDADIIWIAKSMNKAQILEDGSKLYIPTQDEKAVDRLSDLDEGTSHGNSININSASSDLLQSLPGIGEKTAAKIIESRPYSRVEDLRSKGVVGEAVFEKVKGLVTVL